MLPLHRLLGAAVLVTAALVPAVAAARPATQSRIVGGHAPTASYPHQALVEIDLGGGQTGRCAGSLVAARYVVTAAHCLDMPGTLHVTLGQTDVSAPARNFSVVAKAQHPSYDGDVSHGFDVAWLQLDRAADFEQLRLPRPQHAALWQQAGVTGTVIGWGRVEDGQPASNQLLEVQVPIFGDAFCQSTFAGSGLFSTATMLCAGGTDGRDSCAGDSGGPLLAADRDRFILAGVVSFGVGPSEEDTCASGAPGLYSRVGADPLNAWIRQHVPQVEIDVTPAQPEPGQATTLTAAAANPNGAYASFEWDLDGDGAFDDAGGATATVTPPQGVTTVAVRARRGAADDPQRDQEVRRIALEARFRSPVGFAAPAVTVTEGQPAVLTVSKSGGGSGGVRVIPSTGTAAIGGIDVVAALPVDLAFAAEHPAHTVTFPTVDDREVEPAETFRADLTGFSGDLFAGAPAQVVVTVLDNDVHPKIGAATRRAKVRRGRVTLKYTVNSPATVGVRLTDARGRTKYGTFRKRVAAPGTYSAAIRLTRAAKRALRRRRALKARAVFSMVDGTDLLASKTVRVTLKR